MVSASEGEDGPACGAAPATPCESIGAALAVGRTWIRVAAGDYDESIEVDGDGELRIVGAAGGRVNILGDGEVGSAALSVRGASKLVIEGILLTTDRREAGVGVVCEGDAERPELVLRRVTVGWNEAAGLRVSECALRLEDSVIRDSDGPGIEVGRGGGLVAVGTRLTANAPAVDARPGAVVLFAESELVANSEGLIATDANVRVQRSYVVGNDGRGMSLEDSSFNLVNNIVADHGVVGVELRDSEPATSRERVVEHNTIAGEGALGLDCELQGGAHIARNNIVFGPEAAVSGDCAHRFSLMQGGHPGEAILDADPLFVDPAAGDYHLQASSPCVDAGDPASTVSEDIDGDARPQGERPDIGADEVVAEDSERAR